MSGTDTIELVSDVSSLAVDASSRSVATDDCMGAWEGPGCPLGSCVGIEALGISKSIKNVEVIIHQDCVPSLDQGL